MLVIDELQLTKIEEKTNQAFILRMVKYVRTHFPEQCQNSQNDHLENRINKLKKDANSYSIATSKDICDYITLCCKFGDDFCQNKNTPWANECVQQLHEKHGSNIIQQLLNKAKDTIE